ncbi:hypothetical protein [Ramlibacter alkalitolerans]|uniref:Uncharacterized protein n=1 Tax=Ramlibacter alkalitolerans TaxID=2039631 RepID=A0ABS1JTX7_9BURK|nr:hypothetical protein [Ramlibacter alkalitolerans]MBL0427750.1 hypothetical protein [Ramlibacter alkalitolerans]
MTPAFIVVHQGAAYSNGKRADLYFRANPYLAQVGVVEADDRNEGKFQFRALSVHAGHGTRTLGRGGFSAETAPVEMAAVFDAMWNEALEQRFGRANDKSGRSDR